MIGQGVSSRSSHSEAAGRTTFSAKPWTQSRMSFWSCDSSSEKGVSGSVSTVAGGAWGALKIGLLVRVVNKRYTEWRNIEPIATDLTIDELARETGMTVRNIRSHATRGLLPPPEVPPRTGYYGPEHVARLRLIRELQANGYNLGAIKHLLSRSNGSAEDVLGFARALLAPFENEQSEIVEIGELASRFGTAIEPKLAARAEKLGIVVPLGDGRFEIPSPTLL